MILVVRRPVTANSRIDATHAESQLADLFDAYPSELFEIWRTSESSIPGGDLPTDFEVMEYPEVGS